MRKPPLIPAVPHLLHGADYNPEQWLPWKEEIWAEDMRLMKLAGMNCVSIGIFSWAALEPEEGVYTFEWLDEIMHLLHANGMTAILATPSGARPAWMSGRYPEVLRTDENRQRILHGERHNHCWSSAIYREKVQAFNMRLAERYKHHPALGMWHVSNEYNGACHCQSCQEAFRGYLRQRHGSIDALNRAYWSAFWSHTYSDWDQLESPSPRGEGSVHGLALDWKRFTTEQVLSFYRAETMPLTAVTPQIPCTTNLMGTFEGLDYFRLGSQIDVVSWDNYPTWCNTGRDWEVASFAAFSHDLMRGCAGQQPWLLMESSPSATNWQPVGKLRRPGVHLLSSLQAVAHGSDSVQYFQFRQGRGAFEKFHGAVVSQAGHEGTRVFADVCEVGRALARLDDVRGTLVKSRVALLYDWPNRWALEEAQGMLNGPVEMAGVEASDKGYLATALMHYRALWSRGIPVDLIDSGMEVSGYDLVIAPMLYTLRQGAAQRLEEYVRGGGCLVTTYLTGYCDENDLCFLGGFPGPLKETLGLWAEEIDALYPGETNTVRYAGQSYEAFGLCEIIHPLEGTEVLASYEQDFYAGRAALTRRRVRKGVAYHMAARMEQRFLDDFYRQLCGELAIQPILPGELPPGVSVMARTDGERAFVFVMNVLGEDAEVDLGEGGRSLLDGEQVSGRVRLGGHQVLVFARDA